MSAKKKTSGPVRLPAKYQAMRKALLGVLGDAPQTWDEILDAVAEGLPAKVFASLGSIRWHAKWVQLDLEAKGLLERLAGSPPRYRLATSVRRRSPRSRSRRGR